MTVLRIILLVCLIFLSLLVRVSPIKCIIGYGQRGKRYSNEISWLRSCPLTDYCFEAVTTDINKVRKLIDFPWDSYYSQYWIRSCGGDLGTKLNFHPWRSLPRNARKILGSVKINITTPRVITGHGGTEEMDLRYTCRKNVCTKQISAASSAQQASVWLTLIIAAALSTVLLL